MRSSAYYNEIDPYAAQWLRNLIAAGHIAAGDVDGRSIVDVRPDDLRPYRQVHLFAGIGGWSYALRLAGWSDDRPVWTGSCPCQPLSLAGKRRGHADERHLWPAFYRLIAECRPAAVFGEQVASKDGREWLAAVRADLEGAGYAVGAADLCAASVGAPHIRQRLWWVAHDNQSGQPGERAPRLHVDGSPRNNTVRCCAADQFRRVVYWWECSGRDARTGAEAQRGPAVRSIGDDARPSGAAGELADTAGTRCGAGRSGEAGNDGAPRFESAGLRVDGFWSDVVWLPCTDGKARPTQPGIFPLAHGAPGRVGRLRAYGNAIVPQAAAEFIRAADR